MQDFIEQDLLEAGAWQQVDGVGHVWRLAIQSHGADSHILLFRLGNFSHLTPEHRLSEALHIPCVSIREELRVVLGLTSVHIVQCSKVQLPEGSVLRLYSKEQYVSDRSCGRDCQQFSRMDIDASGRLVVPAVAGKFATHCVVSCSALQYQVMYATMLYEHCKCCEECQALTCKAVDVLNVSSSKIKLKLFDGVSMGRKLPLLMCTCRRRGHC